MSYQEDDPLIDHYTHIIEIVESSTWRKLFNSDIPVLVPVKQLMEDFIDDLSDHQLSFLFRALWPKSQRSFCILVDIDQGNFSKWLKGTKTSPKARNAVINYFKNGPLSFSKIPFPLYYNRNMSKIFMEEHEVKKECTINYNHYFLEPSSAINKLISKFRNESIETFILIDGDSNKKTLHNLAFIEPSPEFSSKWQIHTVVVLRKDLYPASVLMYANRPWLTIVKTNSKDKNAADYTILTMLSWIGSYIHYVLKIKLHIILVSADKFANDPVPTISDFGFSVNVIHPRYHLGIWILAKKEISNIIPMEDAQRKEFLRKTKTILDDAMQYIYKLNPGTLKEFISSFKNQISPYDIMELDPYQAALVFATEYHWTTSNVHLDEVNLADNDLRLEFKICWKLSQREFCKKYKINDKAFSKWLENCSLADKKISSALIEWIYDRGIKSQKSLTNPMKNQKFHLE